MLRSANILTTTKKKKKSTTKESVPSQIRPNIFINVLEGKAARQTSELLMTECILVTVEINGQALTGGGTRAVAFNLGWTIELPGGAFNNICVRTPAPRESGFAALVWGLENWCFFKIPR